MSRKHFILIAEAIRNLRLTNEQRIDVAYAMADVLQATNPRFNRSRFISAATMPCQAPVEMQSNRKAA
jgi:hypothetical protein